MVSSASRLRPTANAEETVGTSTVAKAMFSASGRLRMESLLDSIPARRIASALSSAVVGRPLCPGIPLANAV